MLLTETYFISLTARHVNNHNRSMQSILKNVNDNHHIDYLVRERFFELPQPHMLE